MWKGCIEHWAFNSQLYSKFLSIHSVHRTNITYFSLFERKLKKEINTIKATRYCGKIFIVSVQTQSKHIGVAPKNHSCCTFFRWNWWASVIYTSAMNDYWILSRKGNLESQFSLFVKIFQGNWNSVVFVGYSSTTLINMQYEEINMQSAILQKWIEFDCASLSISCAFSFQLLNWQLHTLHDLCIELIGKLMWFCIKAINSIVAFSHKLHSTLIT